MSILTYIISKIQKPKWVRINHALHRKIVLEGIRKIKRKDGLIYFTDYHGNSAVFTVENVIAIEIRNLKKKREGEMTDRDIEDIKNLLKYGKNETL